MTQPTPDTRQPRTLAEALRRQGWYLQGERLMAPHATLWLPEPYLESLDCELVEGQARRRYRRLSRCSYFRSSFDRDCALEDIQSLMDALAELRQVRWPELAQAS